MARRLIATTVMSFALCALFALAASAAPPRGSYQYTITRNGDAIGTHRTELRARGDRLVVQHDVDIRVQIAGWEAYRYRLSSSEFWDGDRLTRLTAHTNKNGTPLAVMARAADRHIEIRGANEARASLEAVPASPAWNVLERRPRTMIDAENGETLSVRVGEPRAATIRAAGRSVACRCYRVAGELSADLCYRADGVLVRKRLRAPDGSTVVELLR